MKKCRIEVCLAPPLMEGFSADEGLLIVVCDILRATSTICAAFDNKVAKIIPVASVKEAHEFKKQGYFVAGERGGIKLDFADAGNSPLEMQQAPIKGKTIVLTTTNGTQAIYQAALLGKVFIGSFLNLKALCSLLGKFGGNLLIVCAGWENKVSLEDTLFAGALAGELLKRDNFYINSDEARLACDLWQVAKSDIGSYIKKASHFQRLTETGQADSVDYCFKTGVSDAVPVFDNGFILNLNE